jgi:hypothetical protein
MRKFDFFHALLLVLLLFFAGIIGVQHTIHWRFIDALKAINCPYCSADEVYLKMYRGLEKLKKGENVNDDFKAKNVFTGRTSLDKAIGIGYEPVLETEGQREYYEDWQAQKEKHLRWMYEQIKAFREKHPETKWGGGKRITDGFLKHMNDCTELTKENNNE